MVRCAVGVGLVGLFAGIMPAGSGADELTQSQQALRVLPAAVPVTFAGGDNYRSLAADYYPPAEDVAVAPIVILLHGEGEDRSAWEPLLPALHRAGFAVLAMDLRGHGERAQAETRRRVRKRDPAVFAEMVHDPWGAYNWVKDQPRVDRTRVALVGAGVGGSVALRYAVQDPTVDVVVCLTPEERMRGLDARRDVPRLKGRKILMLATTAGGAAAERLCRLNTGAEKKIYEGAAAQGAAMLKAVDEAAGDIVEFLDTHRGAAADEPVYASIRSTGHVFHYSDSEWIARINPNNLRVFSSDDEARARGWRASKTKAPYDEQTRRE